MRSRGSKITDIVIIVCAADDGVMPQTKESIEHAKAAGVPIIVFINKIDKSNADIEKVRADLSKVDIISEEWGGDVQFVEGSALKGIGIDKLFDAITLQAEMLELKANPNRLPMGVVIESYIDKGKGVIATLIVLNGTLHARDFIVAGSKYGRIRSLEDTMNNKIDAATPGTPIIVTGLKYTPDAGDKFVGFQDEKFAKNLANDKKFKDKQEILKERITLQIDGDKKYLNIIVKSDTQGTAEVVKSSLSKLGSEEVTVNVISSSVGEINKSDILLASASNAIIYGFNIRITGDDKRSAEEEKIIVKTHTIIYKLLEEVQDLVKGMKAPVFEEKVMGQAKVLKVIFSSNVGSIAGSKVISGMVKVNSKMRLIRNGKTIHEGILDSLQRGSNAIKKVETGIEFGTHIKKYNDIKVDDIIEVYEDIEVGE
jgi:translation initiation factor IF-2